MDDPSLRPGRGDPGRAGRRRQGPRERARSTLAAGNPAGKGHWSRLAVP